MIGQTISHYEIIDKLGEGGMGVVYKAHDRKLGRTVALKFLNHHIGSSDEEKARFINEAKAASALDHGNICNIHAIDESEDGSLFIVMAFYEGISLKNLIEKGPLPIKDVVNYAIQIASGLQKAHEKKIIHRDLKPANILITNDDQVKIIDFGLAKAANQAILTKTGSTLGTAPYMSPEQSTGVLADHRTDTWSLGVILYEMITGLRPFKSEYESALVYSILNEEPEPVTALRTGVPMELEKIVQKCLEKEPADRYQRTDDLIVDLRKVLREESRPSFSKVLSSNGKHQNGTPHHTYFRIKSKPVLFAAVVLFFVIIGLLYLTPEETLSEDKFRSIAVLPLENLSPDPDDAFFSAGMHEDIIIQLSRIGDLQVIARSSVLGYATGQRNIRDISNELGVQSILEGSVRRVSDRVRVTVTLTDAFTNRTLWADTFDRNLTDIFAIQSEIAFEIARALETQLTESEEKQIALQPTAVPEAYEFYLRAREYFKSPGAMYENFNHAEMLLKRAISRDPEFAHAHALLSRVYSSMWWFKHQTTPETLELSYESVRQAFNINPDLAEAYIAMGYYHYHGYRDYAKALENYNIALKSQPNNADIISAIAFVERRLGRFDDSIRNLERAIALDPRNLNLSFNNAHSKMLNRQFEEAENEFRKILEFAPHIEVANIMITLNRILWKGDIDDVHDFFRENPGIKTGFPGDWIRFKILIRDYEGAIKTVRDVPRDLYDGQLHLYTQSYVKAIAYDYAGEPDAAREYYQKALKEYEEMEETYTDDPRYRAALGRIYAGLGNSDEAIKNGMHSVQLITDLVDALEAPPYIHELAIIYAALNKPAESVEILRELLSNPGYLTIPRLNLEPAWDSIRNTPEFRQLLKDFDHQVI